MTPVLILVGALSTYSPGDGHNSGALACGGTLSWSSHHIAIRGGGRRCGAPAVVCVRGRCALTTVQDAGPFGCVRGRAWRNCVRGLLPGWRYRGVVDLAPALWRELGRPPFLAPVTVTVYRARRPEV